MGMGAFAGLLGVQAWSAEDLVPVLGLEAGGVEGLRESGVGGKGIEGARWAFALVGNAGNAAVACGAGAPSRKRRAGWVGANVGRSPWGASHV